MNSLHVQSHLILIKLKLGTITIPILTKEAQINNLPKKWQTTFQPRT